MPCLFCECVCAMCVPKIVRISCGSSSSNAEFGSISFCFSKYSKYLNTIIHFHMAAYSTELMLVSYKWFHIPLEPKYHVAGVWCQSIYDILLSSLAGVTRTRNRIPTRPACYTRVCVLAHCPMSDVRTANACWAYGWRNIVKCMCICTRLSLSAKRANSQHQIKYSPFSKKSAKLVQRHKTQPAANGDEKGKTSCAPASGVSSLRRSIH